LADTRRDQEYLGIDSNVLVAYLVPEHPDHELTGTLTKKKHAVNPTVLHETYHTCVFKLRRNPQETVRVLLQYMNSSLCLPTNSSTVSLGLKLALKHHLGGRDALIIASYISSKQVNKFVTLDQSLLSLKHVLEGGRRVKIVAPRLSRAKRSS